MKWIEDNLLGMVLLTSSGVLLLLSLLLAIIWTRPVAVDIPARQMQQSGDEEIATVGQTLGPLSDYQVITARPVFNESRSPVVIEEVVEEPVAEVTIEVKDPPAVKLTGVMILPGKRIASLTPVKDGQEGITLLEGQSFTGEYVGWQLSAVGRRSVILMSLNGAELHLALEVHDLKIKQPPRLVAPAKPVVNGDGQPLDRAEQIRQRIAERREELRRDEELMEGGTKIEQTAAQREAAGRQSYQNAIRALMNKGRNSNDKKDG